MIASLPIVERGVFRAPYTHASGAAILTAVNAAGRCVGSATVPLGGNERTYTAALYAFLDAVDPVAASPALTLVRGADGRPTPPPRSAPRRWK
jgi:hypothetical protein